jgi:hypothetical protein
MRGPPRAKSYARFSATTYGGSGPGGTTTDEVEVGLDGEFERQVTVDNLREGARGLILRPKDARRLARILLRAAKRCEKEQHSIDTVGWR